MNEQIQEKLNLARKALCEERVSDALHFYADLLAKDIENLEVTTFCDLAILDEEFKDEEEKLRKIKMFRHICTEIADAIKEIAALPQTDEMDLFKFKYVVYTCLKFIPRVWSYYQLSHKSEVLKDGVAALYNLGDAIEKEFADHKNIAKLCIYPWEEAISLQQKFYNMISDKTLPETYAKKIQAFKPEYVLPKKAGCIELGDKR